MPVAGRKPKPAEERRNHHAPSHEWTEVPDVPYEGDAPLLPQRWMVDKDEEAKVRLEWPARTRQWWRVVSSMPHCVLWTESDWSYALDCAEAHARFMEGASNGAELRIREKPLGITLDARRDLRIRYVPAKPVEPERDESVPDNVRYLDL